MSRRNHIANHSVAVLHQRTEDPPLALTMVDHNFDRRDTLTSPARRQLAGHTTSIEVVPVYNDEIRRWDFTTAPVAHKQEERRA